ncbi:hypothetical protein TNIN_301761 [Trichonephila inaurata madagascariensis]|uniref:Uncharacterized protein n=1 Tax=Trichonephila inaurata madagascariensis TaxID=2747483 RepID=A0A8X6YYE7_9ARAC|nr:hypothetical protein TNIN_301761 [Trichonephila inaurata madagascariensis]
MWLGSNPKPLSSVKCLFLIKNRVYPGKDRVLRVARIRTSHGERIRPFQRLYPLEVSAKTEISVLKFRKASLPVEKTPESSADHVLDSPTDYVPILLLKVLIILRRNPYQNLFRLKGP